MSETRERPAADEHEPGPEREPAGGHRRAQAHRERPDRLGGEHVDRPRAVGERGVGIVLGSLRRAAREQEIAPPASTPMPALAASITEPASSYDVNQ